MVDETVILVAVVGTLTAIFTTILAAFLNRLEGGRPLPKKKNLPMKQNGYSLRPETA